MFRTLKLSLLALIHQKQWPQMLLLLLLLSRSAPLCLQR
jgi:hypothetical protein